MTASTYPARPTAGRVLLRVLAGSLCLAVAFFATAPAARAETTPEEAYVQSLSDRAIGILSSKTLDKQARYAAFHDLILDNIELERLAGFALGRYAGSMHAGGHYDEYVKLFGEYIARVYAARMSGYSGEHLRLDKTTPRGTDVVVSSTIEPGAQGGDPIAVDWRLSHSAGSFKIVDVRIIGAWMSIEQQEQFASIITNNNRDTNKLIEYLEQQTSAPLPG